MLITGPQGAGKSTHVDRYVDDGYRRLNRDELGGKLDKLNRMVESGLREGTTRFVLDNTYPKRRQRRPLVELGRRAGVPVRVAHMDTSIEDAQTNICTRIVRKYGKLLMPEEIKEHAKKDPNLFGPQPLFRYRKVAEPPMEEEGFASVEIIPFERRTDEGYTGKALILDYDGTLRKTKSGAKYPTDPDDVEVLPGRAEILREYVELGYLLLGASNQSGVAKGELTWEQAHACFERTNELLGLEIEIMFCPHSFYPQVCWCRKPLPGMLVAHIERHKLDRKQTIYVGDMKTDETCAARASVPFKYAEEFFG